MLQEQYTHTYFSEILDAKQTKYSHSHAIAEVLQKYYESLYNLNASLSYILTKTSLDTINT